MLPSAFLLGIDWYWIEINYVVPLWFAVLPSASPDWGGFFWTWWYSENYISCLSIWIVQMPWAKCSNRPSMSKRVVHGQSTWTITQHSVYEQKSCLGAKHMDNHITLEKYLGVDSLTCVEDSSHKILELLPNPYWLPQIPHKYLTSTSGCNSYSHWGSYVWTH